MTSLGDDCRRRQCSIRVWVVRAGNLLRVLHLDDIHDLHAKAVELEKHLAASSNGVAVIIAVAFLVSVPVFSVLVCGLDAVALLDGPRPGYLRLRQAVGRARCLGKGFIVFALLASRSASSPSNNFTSCRSPNCRLVGSSDDFDLPTAWPSGRCQNFPPRNMADIAPTPPFHRL